MPFEVIAALRFLREGLAQTLLIVIGVSVGVAVIVFMSALLAGLQGNFIRRVLSTQAHIVLVPPREESRRLIEREGVVVMSIVQKRAQRLRSIDQWQKVRDELKRWPGVTAVSPMASGAAFAVRGNANRSISLLGVEPEAYFRIVKIPEMMVAGSVRLDLAGHPDRNRARQRSWCRGWRQGAGLHRSRSEPDAHDLWHLRSREQGGQPAQHVGGIAHRAVTA